MAQQGSYPIGSRVLAPTDTLTGVVTNATTDVPVSALTAYVQNNLTGGLSNAGGMVTSDDIAFALSVPLTSRGMRYMPQQIVSSVLTFTAAAGAVKNSIVYLRLVADGVNTPLFSGYKEWGGSMGYNNSAGIVNQIQFYFDGYDYWFMVSQAIGAIPYGAAYVRLTSLVNVAESGTGPYTYSGNGAFYSTVPGPGGVATTAFQSGVDGSAAATLGGFDSTSTSEAILGIVTGTSLVQFASLPYALYSNIAGNVYQIITSGTISAGNGTTVAPINGDIMRVRRSGANLILEVARSGTPATFTTVHTYSGVSTGVLNIQAMAAGTSYLSDLLGVGLA